MAKEEGVIVEGTIAEVLGGDRFRVKLANDTEVQAHLSGKIRKNHIRILLGDRVNVELGLYDLTMGRITYRHK